MQKCLPAEQQKLSLQNVAFMDWAVKLQDCYFLTKICVTAGDTLRNLRVEGWRAWDCKCPCPQVSVLLLLKKWLFVFLFPKIVLLFSRSAFCFPEVPFYFPEVSFYFSKMTYCFPKFPFSFSKVSFGFIVHVFFPRMLFSSWLYLLILLRAF